MAAPETTPDLSVVQGERSARPLAASPRSTSPASQPAPRRPERSRVPWWVVAVVAAVGLILFLDQYQRAGRLEERVAALTEELSLTGQQLAQAQQHVAAHQAHLDQVRAGLGDLGARVSGLQVLADRDPLAPPASAEAPAPEAASAQMDFPADADAVDAQAGAAPADASAAGSEALTDAEGYFWRADVEPPAAESTTER